MEVLIQQEIDRLKNAWLNPVKEYRRVTEEQLNVAIAFLDLFKTTEELDLLFSVCEMSWTTEKEDGYFFKKPGIVDDNEFTQAYQQWIDTNYPGVKLNSGMICFLDGVIEHYLFYELDRDGHINNVVLTFKEECEKLVSIINKNK